MPNLLQPQPNPQHRRLVERAPDDLHAQRQAVISHAKGHGERWQARERREGRELVVGEIRRQIVRERSNKPALDVRGRTAFDVRGRRRDGPRQPAEPRRGCRRDRQQERVDVAKNSVEVRP